MLVADGLATRGLDLLGVRHVVLYDLPTDVTTYVHAAGRTRGAARRGSHVLVQNRGQQQAFSQFHPPGAAAAESADVRSMRVFCGRWGLGSLSFACFPLLGFTHRRFVFRRTRFTEPVPSSSLLSPSSSVPSVYSAA